MKQFALMLVMGGFLAACDSSDTALNEQDVTAGSDVSAAADASVQPASQPEETQAAAVTQSEEKAEKKKLNLSLPENLSTGGAEEPLKEEPRMLPDMFAEKESRTSVGGGVHRDEENPDMMRSIDGAEVSVEIKTD